MDRPSHSGSAHCSAADVVTHLHLRRPKEFAVVEVEPRHLCPIEGRGRAVPRSAHRVSVELHGMIRHDAEGVLLRSGGPRRRPVHDGGSLAGKLSADASETSSGVNSWGDGALRGSRSSSVILSLSFLSGINSSGVLNGEDNRHFSRQTFVQHHRRNRGGWRPPTPRYRAVDCVGGKHTLKDAISDSSIAHESHMPSREA